jgi:hypothetical protein
MTRTFIVTPYSECQKPQPRHGVTVTMTVVECVMLPPVPLMANRSAPSGAALGTEIVRMDFPAPGAGTRLALKEVPEPPTR